MLKKINRFSREPGIKFLKTINADIYSIKIAKRSDSGKKFGFVVSKKIDKRAVIRNSIKRKLSSCIKNLIDSVNEGIIIIFIVKKAISNKSSEEICFYTEKVLKDNGVLK